jgi:drug/metabolite transporter (DMT)-like permease
VPHAPRTGDWVALLALTFFWGTAFLFNAMALQSLPPAVLVAARIALGAVFLLLVMPFAGVRLPRTASGWWTLTVVAVLGMVAPMQLIAWGQQHIGSAETGVLMAISPLVVYTLAHFFLPGERLSAWRLGGFLFGFAGVVLVIGPERFSTQLGSTELLGALAVLGAAVCYSANSVYARRAARQQPLALATGMMLVATLLCLPPGLVSLPGLEAPPPPAALIAVLILGLVSTGFASLLYFRLVQGPGPGFLTLVTYLVPVWAVLGGVLVLQEPLRPGVLGGLALILSGIAVSEWGPRLLRGNRWSRLRQAAAGAALLNRDR